MGAEDAVFDAFQRLLEELERYAPLPPGADASTSPPLPSASIRAGPADREPVIEVIETVSHVHVTVEIAGAVRESIDIRATPNALAVRVAADERRYETRIPLPAKIRVDSVRATERNGVLDVTLEKDLGDPAEVRRR